MPGKPRLRSYGARATARERHSAARGKMGCRTLPLATCSPSTYGDAADAPPSLTAGRDHASAEFGRVLRVCGGSTPITR